MPDESTPFATKITANDPETQSANLVGENLEKLKALFPDAFSEGKVDFDVLRQLLGGAVDAREEKYGLNWHGKRQARQIALTPSVGTLRPCPEESVDWDTTQNLMIEGDNLEVLKLLQKSYAGKVKLIYIDPPYNTGNEFVYPDNYRDGIGRYWDVTGQGKKLASNPESSGRYHTDWLNMMYPRLRLARDFLQDGGVLFVSIDDHEVANLREVCDEVFGGENLICQFTWVKKRKGSHLSDTHRSMTEYVLAFAKNKQSTELFGEAAYAEKMQPLAKKTNSKKSLKLPAESVLTRLPDGRYEAGVRGEGDSRLVFETPFEVRRGRIVGSFSVAGPFVWTQEKLNEELRLGTVLHLSSKFGFNAARHDQSEKYKAPSTLMSGIGTNEDAFEELAVLFGSERVFDFAKPTSLIQYIVDTCTHFDRNGIVMDFFAGSGSLGHAVLAQNAADGGSRRYVLVQLPERLLPDVPEHQEAVKFCDRLSKPRVLSELTKERLRRAGTKVRKEHPLFKGDTGFRVFKLDSSNIRAWDPNRDKLKETLHEQIEHLLPGRTERDVLFELLLKLGLDLTVPIVSRTIAGKTVHSIGEGALMASLADGLTHDSIEEFAKGILAWRREIAPPVSTSFVFKDSGFVDDVAKLNLVETLKQGLPSDQIASIRSV